MSSRFIITRGERVVDRSGNEGVVRWIGRPKSSHSRYVGIEYDKPVGKHNGTVKGVKYFECSDKHGALIKEEFVKPKKLIERKKKIRSKSTSKPDRTRIKNRSTPRKNQPKVNKTNTNSPNQRSQTNSKRLSSGNRTPKHSKETQNKSPLGKKKKKKIESWEKRFNKEMSEIQEIRKQTFDTFDEIEELKRQIREDQNKTIEFEKECNRLQNSTKHCKNQLENIKKILIENDLMKQDRVNQIFFEEYEKIEKELQNTQLLNKNENTNEKEKTTKFDNKLELEIEKISESALPNEDYEKIKLYYVLNLMQNFKKQQKQLNNNLISLDFTIQELSQNL
ncbi:dynactin 1-related microtubule-binding [Anaeramoeba flamelloides]|uniref:Dynactin 1-related microtubule-binding n=1 Tax=Anaeramoeba flamelloides TaxID=1746091 RepID=A0ABQ8Y265_9EUKA|nr:dynactin 1-related microtubule-binding [Anaeramoeba flamelloides]